MLATILRIVGDRPAMRIVQLPAMLLAGIAIAWYVVFRCPRCHQAFFYKGPMRSLTGRSCMHCGLPRNAPFDPDHPPA